MTITHSAEDLHVDEIDFAIPQYSLDWSSGKVHARDIDRSIVERKFALYDYAVANNLIGTHDQATRLLSDDTIFAYAFLRWEGQPIKLRYYQDAVLCDNHKRIDVEAANQQGKSFSLCAKAAVNFLRDHGRNTTIGLISKSMGQNSMNMRMVRKMLSDASVTYTPGSNDNMTVMVHDLGNGYTNTLVCSVASTSALGFPFDWLYLDEYEFWENPEGLEYMYDQVLEPRTYHTKGQIVIYSNPNGRNFVSEKLHHRLTIDGQKQFHVYNVTFLDNPSNTREEYELLKRQKHPIIFASTVAALRVESEGAALNESDIRSTFDDSLDNVGFRGINPRESWWFLDLGFVKDQSVLVGCYKTQDVNGVTIYNFPIKTYPVAYAQTKLWGFEEGDEPSVPSLVKRFGGDNFVFELDLTGKEGNEINAQKAGLDCSGIKMSGPWKATHYDRFISLCKLGRIKVQREENWLDGENKDFAFQARSLIISTKMPNGNNRPYPLYHHSKETDHDDIIDAIVGCLSLCDDEMGKQGFFELIAGATQEEIIRSNSNHIEKNTNPDRIMDEVVAIDDVDKSLYEQRISEYQNFF
jgi:hypothetical protein